MTHLIIKLEKRKVARFLQLSAAALCVVPLLSGMAHTNTDHDGMIVRDLPLPYVEPQRTYVAVDSKQLDCLAANIYYESRNQPELGQLAIGLTTLARARAGDWPKSICGVVYQKGQFSWTDDKAARGSKVDTLAYLRSMNLATKLLSGDYDNLSQLFNPTHFHTTKVNPDWSKNLSRIATINDHIFYE